LKVRFVGSPVQEPVNPGLVQVKAAPPAAPLTVAVPLHPAVDALGDETVNVPVKLLALAVPETVPLQSAADVDEVQVPVTVPDVWLSWTVMETVGKLEDRRLPLQFPETCAKAFPLTLLGELELPPHAETTSATTNSSRRMSEPFCI
jgi:hypothetical protein